MSSRPGSSDRDAHVAAWVYRDEDWPHGMLCETCKQPFREGDEIRGNFTSMFEDGTPVMDDAKCPRCWSSENAGTGAREAEGSGLLSRPAGNRRVGSNPTPSASEPERFSGASGQREAGPTGNEGRRSGSDQAAARDRPERIFADDELEQRRRDMASSSNVRTCLSCGQREVVADGGGFKCRSCGAEEPSAARERLSSALTRDDLARLRQENERDLERARAEVARLEVEQEQIVYAIVSKRSRRG